MTIDKIVAVAVAGVVLAWPAILELLKRPAASGPRSTYLKAIENLGAVRTRLAETDGLGEAQKAAIDTLTLALVSGSEK